MNIPDINSLDYGQLELLTRQCNERMEALRKEGAAELRQRFEDEARRFGLTLSDISGGPPPATAKRRGRKPGASKSVGESESIGLARTDADGTTTSSNVSVGRSNTNGEV